MTRDRMFWQIIEGIFIAALLILFSIQTGWLTFSQAVSIGCFALALMVVVLPCINEAVDKIFRR